MLKQRREAAQQVAAALMVLEDAIDEALTASGEFNALLPSARKAASVAAPMGQQAFERAVAVHSSLAAARREVVETHHLLDVTKHQMGLDEFFPVGDTRPKPPAPGGLRAVDAGDKVAA